MKTISKILMAASVHSAMAGCYIAEDPVPFKTATNITNLDLDECVNHIESSFEFAVIPNNPASEAFVSMFLMYMTLGLPSFWNPYRLSTELAALTSAPDAPYTTSMPNIDMSDILWYTPSPSSFASITAGPLGPYGMPTSATDNTAYNNAAAYMHQQFFGAAELHIGALFNFNDEENGFCGQLGEAVGVDCSNEMFSTSMFSLMKGTGNIVVPQPAYNQPFQIDPSFRVPCTPLVNGVCGSWYTAQIPSTNMSTGGLLPSTDDDHFDDPGSSCAAGQWEISSPFAPTGCYNPTTDGFQAMLEDHGCDAAWEVPPSTGNRYAEPDTSHSEYQKYFHMKTAPHSGQAGLDYLTAVKHSLYHGTPTTISALIPLYTAMMSTLMPSWTFKVQTPWRLLGCNGWTD